MSSLVIRGGAVVDPESGTVTPADVLIEGGQISALGPDLDQPAAEVLDASGMLVLPGLVDTHRHTWEAVLRASAPDRDLGGYLDLIREHGPRFRPADVYASTLLGALECLSAGITTLFDWSHIQNTPEHTDAAVGALRAAGIRALFGYGAPSHGVHDRGRWAEHPRRVRDRLFGADDELVAMALAPMGPAFGSREDTVADYQLARELGVRISPHVGHALPDSQRAVEILAELDLLGPDITYVHGNQLTARSMDLLAGSGGGVAVAPAVEARMGHGPDPIGRLRARGIPVGLGVDVVTTVPGDLFSVMRAALLTAHPDLSAPDALRLATIEGAAAIGMADRVGSLRPGKQADVILLRTDTPGMAPVLDPIAAVVTAADTSVVDTVLVAGQVRKRGGRLAADLGDALARAVATTEYVTRTSNVESPGSTGRLEGARAGRADSSNR
jgi:cytosine/adenosine deaminase-related metal-dependent hydrolase